MQVFLRETPQGCREWSAAIVYNSDDSRTEWTVYKKIKPTRDTSRHGFEFLE